MSLFFLASPDVPHSESIQDKSYSQNCLSIFLHKIFQFPQFSKYLTKWFLEPTNLIFVPCICNIDYWLTNMYFDGHQQLLYFDPEHDTLYLQGLGDWWLLLRKQVMGWVAWCLLAKNIHYELPRASVDTKRKGKNDKMRSKKIPINKIRQ